MSHVFDSGLSDAQRSLIAAAITTKLRPLLLSTLGGAANGFLELIATVGFTIDGKHDDYGLDLLMEQISAKAPSIAISPGAMVLAQAGGPGKSRGDLTIDLYFVSTHNRDLTEGRITSDAATAIADTADPGIFATVELAWALLFDVDLGVDHVQQLKLHREEELISDAQKTIWKQEWRVSVTRDANMYRGLVQQLLGINTTLVQTGLDPDPIPVFVNTDT